MHKKLEEFEFQSDPTTDYGVSCPRGSKTIVSTGFLHHLIQIYLILADKQNWQNILCLIFGLIAVSSSELLVFEYCRLWCFQTFFWLLGERSLPIGLLVFMPPP